ncbi:hypothetical protein KGF54_000732 [Candida jiufengensis]|uniref:uncharacterized protein n=1 Tax=Candida jiufengensis TaxID=497108 RepID=UPI002223FAE3|nr:uncharacterized protein KGF54_000732 [Candida jiufengensis]KAI5956257.1 hypothetical protein KGF54_000732 [Candida jiufengensis]
MVRFEVDRVLESKIEDLTLLLEDQRDELNLFTKQTNEKIERTNEKIERTNEKIEGLEKNCANLLTAFREIRDHLENNHLINEERNNQDVEELNSELSKIRNDVKKHDYKTTKIKSDVKKHTFNISKIKNDIKKIKNKMNSKPKKSITEFIENEECDECEESEVTEESTHLESSNQKPKFFFPKYFGSSTFEKSTK